MERHYDRSCADNSNPETIVFLRRFSGHRRHVVLSVGERKTEFPDNRDGRCFSFIFASNLLRLFFFIELLGTGSDDLAAKFFQVGNGVIVTLLERPTELFVDQIKMP